MLNHLTRIAKTMQQNIIWLQTYTIKECVSSFKDLSICSSTRSLSSCKLSQGDTRYDPPLHQRSTNDRPGCFFSIGLIDIFWVGVFSQKSRSDVNLQATYFFHDFLDVPMHQKQKIGMGLEGVVIGLFASHLLKNVYLMRNVSMTFQLPSTLKAPHVRNRNCRESRCHTQVLPANQDMSVSDSLQLARQVDPQGLRHLVMVFGYCFGARFL